MAAPPNMSGGLLAAGIGFCDHGPTFCDSLATPTMTTGRRYSRVVEGSCWTCRRKRVKCDLGHPTCARCQKGALRCDYGAKPPVRWVNSSGTLSSTNRRYSTPALPSPSSTTSTWGRLSTERDLFRRNTLPEQPSRIPLDVEGQLLYFANAVLPRFQLLEIALPIDLGQLLENEALKQAALAVSQAHFEHCTPTSTNAALMKRREARNTAVHSLRTRLSGGIEDEESAQAVFTVNVLLCMLDGMIEPSSEQPDASVWHLKGGYAMLGRWRHMPTSLLARGGLQSHLLSVFVTMDLVHALLSGSTPYFDPLLWHMFAGAQAWWGILPPNDQFLATLRSMSELASLGQLVESHLPSTDGSQLAERCLPALGMSSNDSENRTSDQSVGAEGTWRAFCRLYEISCTIYINRALRLRPICDVDVQAATRKGVEMLVDQVLPGMMAHCVILPLLIIGAHCIHSQDRKAVLQSLEPSVAYLAFGNLQRMSDWLKDSWVRSAMDLSWWDQFQAISDSIFLF